ncbi:MAG: MFS transporter [Bdellovibrionales bacterium]|nr:MFS transporter [Bdellovibrionales bacterium]
MFNLKDKNFSYLWWTQFLGALNDNVLKNSLVVLLAFRGVEMWGLRAEALISLATLLFILPFFLFSATAGQLADKFERSNLVRWIKFSEIIIMILAGVGFYFHSFPLLFTVLFFMGLHSTFFGPIKYSILPELISSEKLTAANAYVEVGTFIAILLGTILGGYFISLPQGELYLIGLLLSLSVGGYITSYGIPSVKIGDPNLRFRLNPFIPIFETLRDSKKNKAVFNSILGISWFWLLGAVILSLLPTLTTKVLHGDEHIVTIFLAMFTVGIALGALLCEKLSFGQVEIGLVPLGSLGMTFFMLYLAFSLKDWNYPNELVSLNEWLNQSGSLRLLGALLGIALSGGMFTVPLYTLIQERSVLENRSRVIGANNIINSMFMVIGSGLLLALLQWKVSLEKIIIIYSILNLIVSMYIYSLVPEFTLRFLAWLLAHCFYRLRSEGKEYFPKAGPVILVCNHVSYVDWMIIGAALRRPVKFVMYYKFASIPLLKYLMKQAGVIPIAGKNENPEVFANAFKQIGLSLNQGEVVCIFPEGGLSQDGNLQKFKKGVEHILITHPVPVIPMALSGLWGSIFSHKDARALTKWPKRIWFPVTLRLDPPVDPAQATADFLEKKVELLLKLLEKETGSLVIN